MGHLSGAKILCRRCTEMLLCQLMDGFLSCVSGTGISSGVNFAIPIDTVVQSVPNLIVYGTSVSNRFWFFCSTLSASKCKVSLCHVDCSEIYILLLLLGSVHSKEHLLNGDRTRNFREQIKTKPEPEFSINQ